MKHKPKSYIPKKFNVAVRPARDEHGQLIDGICVICGNKSRYKGSFICDDPSEVCWQRAIDRGYIIPLEENKDEPGSPHGI